MSVNASKHELIQLIYRHLKDHGFHSAADELQRHNPQVDTEVSATLLDIYSSWFNDSKKKKKLESAKHSKSKEQGQNGAEAVSSQTPVEGSNSSDCKELSQSLLPQTPFSDSKMSASATPKKPKAAASTAKQKLERLFTPVNTAPCKSSETTKIEGNTPSMATKTKAGASSSSKVRTPKKKVSSTSEQETPAVGTLRKKKSEKSEMQKKSPASVKREKGESKSPVRVIKKSKTQTKADVVTAGGEDSDSDSSLDVEKWKKLLRQMTDADVAKMDTVNALDCSASPPKAKRVRKPRTKPPTKTDSIVQPAMPETPAKNIKPKKSRTKKSELVTSAILSQEQSINTDTDKQTTQAPTLSSPKQIMNDKRKAMTPSEEKIGDTLSKPKKKKLKETAQGSVDENTDTSKNEKDSKGEKKSKNEVMEQEEFGDKTLKLKKKRKRNETEEKVKEKIQIENVDNEEIEEQKLHQKKDKKKKKTDHEEHSGETAEEDKVNKKNTFCKEKLEQKIEDDSKNFDLVPEKVEENEELIVKEKKVKNKKKKREENSVNIPEEYEIKKNDKTVESEEKSEQIVKEKKKRKKDYHNEEVSVHVVEERSAKISESSDGKTELEQNTNVKENKEDSTLKNSVPLFSPNATPETQKKKKKSKLKSDEGQETPPVLMQDTEEAEALLTTSCTSHKKKKKSSKNSEP
ncbi:uncharacterized protein DDB_G0286299-like [Antennarius striatus]|uniref:uncharacterized protein DDB_G0286299-like n=1 Tax=Antennarius striatus TaxID=241820 RepID=UPI0035B16457